MDGGKEFPSNMNNPLEPLTPAVSTPDWNNESNLQMDVDQPSTSNSSPLAIELNDKDETATVSVANNTENDVAPTASVTQDTNVTRTPERPESSEPSTSAAQAPQLRMLSDVALTPMSVNPHSTMASNVLIPVTSDITQAKNNIKFQNCVSTVHLGCPLNLLDIYSRTRYSEYNPSKFRGVVMKILEPKATALVFRTGKIVCTGTKSEYDAYIAARKFARIMQKLGFDAKFLDFKIKNFIATADLRFPVRLEALQQAHGQFTSYEPELFPGLVYRIVRPRVVLLIFVNGKIVLTGGKSRNEIDEALDIIYPILRSYRRN